MRWAQAFRRIDNFLIVYVPREKDFPQGPAACDLIRASLFWNHCDHISIGTSCPNAHLDSLIESSTVRVISTNDGMCVLSDASFGVLFEGKLLACN